MKIKLRLRHKIQFIIISLSVLVFTGAIGYIAFKDRQSSYENQTRLIEAQTEKHANQLKVLINEDFAVVRTLALAFKTYKFLETDQYQKLVNQIYDHVFQGNPEFYQLWDSWELNVVDSTWNRPTGRITNTRLREKGEMKRLVDIRSLDGDNKYYAKDKALARELISEIYADAFSEQKADKKIMTTYEAPIMDQKKFVGLIGVDVTLDRFQEIVSGIQLEDLEGSYAFLISHNGKYAGHPDNDKLNTFIPKNPTSNPDFNIYQKIKLGKPFSIVNDRGQEERFVSYFPIKISRTDTYWYLGITVPRESIIQQVNENLYVSFIVGIIGLILLGIVIYFVSINISRPVQSVTKQLNKLSRGEIKTSNKLKLETGDEIEEMAEALNQTIEKLNQKNQFAKHLGRGDLDQKLTIEDKEDELGQSLIEMRENLQKARKEQQERQKEDEINNWINQAITETSDIFRKHNQNIKNLTFSTLQYLLNYLEVSQGGIYVKNDEEDEIFYELISAIAYGRDKLIEKKIKNEEGLVGRCAYEGLTVYMTEIPEEYVNIKTGLGDANPRTILLVPIKNNEEVLGVIELISFNEFADYQVKMVEQIGGNLAATIANVRINQKTEKLLHRSQKQTDELAQQEQEMRQNVEEMKATQEEAQQRQHEMTALHEAVNDIAYVAEFDMDGHLIDMNKNLEVLLAKPKDQVIGMQQGSFAGTVDQDVFEETWEQLRAGEPITKEQKIKSGNKYVWLLETYKPVINAEGEPYKVVNIGIDITHTKER
ncbi:MAG TPA: GAF domain-containing protein [Salinivirga sp.]|uniref:HAMP domain-containing protein n=1 Tax=Salinivirga sp. TaxID=1970192 RepID=UPI002B4807A3|nr:GAF domain-containing protein [Salinivirga sp.]HKK58899.1 GAF domain-containing protein [Salinivirga sp.]